MKTDLSLVVELASGAARAAADDLRAEIEPLDARERRALGDLVCAMRMYEDRDVSRAEALAFVSHLMQVLALDAAKRRGDTLAAELDADRAAKAAKAEGA